MPLDDNARAAQPPVQVQITPPRFERALITIRGTAPYVGNKFSTKARNQIEETQRQGSVAKKGRRKEARDFEEDWRNAQHISAEGWLGVPAPAFRAALIDACRMAGFAMTRAKMSIFVEADGFDADDKTPLVRIEGTLDPPGAPMPVRNKSGVVDLRCRPTWPEWSIKLPLRWDADQFSAADVINLLVRAGVQVGVGEGRPFSKDSNGMGWGTWEVVQ